jgi:hypothetical protein
MRAFVAFALLFAADASHIALADPPPAPLKNLQVLPKTTTKEEIKQIMRAQSRDLGVECDFCHDPPDMASDSKAEKKTARQMMKMTAEINSKWLAGIKDADKNRVTCGTCHRGSEHPPKFVPEKK